MYGPKNYIGAKLTALAAGAAQTAISSYLSGRGKSRAAVALRKRRPIRSKVKSRKAASYTRTTTRRKKSRVTETSTNHADYSATYASFGKPLRGLSRVKRLVRSSEAVWRLGYQNISPFPALNGMMKLCNTLSQTGTINETFEIPLHMWEVTAAPQRDTSGAAANPTIFLKPYFTANTASGNADSFDSSLTVGTNTNWAVLERPHERYGTTAQVGAEIGVRSMIEWVKADLMLYCPLQQPTRFDIAMVQIRDVDLDPRTIQAAAPTTVAKPKAFYQWLIKRYAFSPLATLDNHHARYLKVLKRVTVHMDPLETSDRTVSRQKRVRLFVRLNRKVNYDWLNNDVVSMDPVFDGGTGVYIAGGPSEIEQNGNQAETSPHPKSRVFLMIRAQAGRGQTSTTSPIFYENIQPSYDIKLEVKHVQAST